MGTTGDSLAAGSTNYVLVAAIEGYAHLLTNHGDTSAVVTAFAALSDGDWTSAIGGLFAEVDNEQTISPWEPMHGGGRCTLTVIPDAADTFGIDVNRRAAGWESELTAEANRTEDTITVQSTAGAASSGVAYIGTEAIAYSGKTATTLTGLTRGKWSPFGNGSTTSDGRFAQHHRVGLSASSVQLAPLVSAQPRTWIGRWVGLWMVRSSGGTLDTVAQAQLIYAGKIAEIRDDPNHFGTVLDLRHVLDVIREATVGRDMWSGASAEGVNLKQGMVFSFSEYSSVTGANDATDMTVVASPSVDFYEIPEGYYTLTGLMGRINGWLAANYIATTILTDSVITLVQTESGYRVRFTSYLTGDPTSAEIKMPAQVARMFGWGQAEALEPGYRAGVKRYAFGENEVVITGTEPPLKSILDKVVNFSSGLNFDITTTTGTIRDQFDSLPSALRPGTRDVAGITDPGWGCFVFDGKVLMRAAWDPAVSPVATLLAGQAQNQMFSGAFTGDLEFVAVPYDDAAEGTIPVRQVMVFESTLATFLMSVIYSTGTAGYNSDTYDGLPFGSGIGIPGVLLGAEFEDSIAGLPGADESLVVVVDKPHTLADLLQGDLVLRLVFPVWRDQHVRFNSWRTPDTGAATFTLTESNKAEPSGNATGHRSATAVTTEWQRPIVKIQYNRNFSDLSSDGFQDSLTLEDRTAIDDAGGDGAVVTIKARNTFGQFEQTGAAVESLVPPFLAAMPLFSRPQRKVTRSIDARFFEQIGVGDVVLFSDAFARDPETGIRGIAVRPAMVTRHRWSLGGAIPGSDQPADMGGEVDLFFTDRNATLGDALYAPAADVDSTYSSGGFTAGYNAGYNTVRCVARAYNQSVTATINGVPVLLEEATDATLFPAGYAVRIVERDPADINDPQVWTTTVASQSGDDIVLAAPLTGFDTAKQYRVIFDDFDACTTAQKLKAFQADATDGLILDASGAFLYKSQSAERNWTANASPPVIEMLPALAYADGAGRDVGNETALLLMLDNLLDYKTGINQPVLFPARQNTANAGVYELVYLAPVWLTREGLSNAVTRELSVSILHYSTDGTAATVRVSLCRSRPVDASRLNVSRGAVYAEMYRSTTSTSVVASTVSVLDAAVKDPNTGRAWLLIECGYKAGTLGVSRFQEGPRVQPQAWTL